VKRAHYRTAASWLESRSELGEKGDAKLLYELIEDKGEEGLEEKEPQRKAREGWA